MYSVKIKTSYKDVEEGIVVFPKSVHEANGLRATLIFLTLN